MHIQAASTATPASHESVEEKPPTPPASSSLVWHSANSLSQLAPLRRQLRASGDPVAPLFAERLDQLQQALRDGQIEPQAHADSAQALLEAAGMVYCGENFEQAVFEAAGFSVAALAGVAPPPSPPDPADAKQRGDPPHHRAFSLQCGPHRAELRLAGTEAAGPFSTPPPHNASLLFGQIGQDLGMQVDAKNGVWADLQALLRRNLRVRDNFFRRFKQLNERGQERATHSGWLPTSEATLVEQDDSGIFRPEPASRGAAQAALRALVTTARASTQPDGTGREP